MTMRIWFKALVEHLRDKHDVIVDKVDVVVHDFNETYGAVTHVETMDKVDFDKLLDEIDAFAETFNQPRETGD